MNRAIEILQTYQLLPIITNYYQLSPIITTPSDLFGINCATGMSALMRKELLDNKGGFEAFGCYLAEDFFFAQAVQVGS